MICCSSATADCSVAASMSIARAKRNHTSATGCRLRQLAMIATSPATTVLNGICSQRSLSPVQSMQLVRGDRLSSSSHQNLVRLFPVDTSVCCLHPSTPPTHNKMHGQHVRSGMLCATTGHIHMPAPTLRPCTGRRASTTAQASQQQQQQQQPQPVRSFGEMMQQYKSIAPAAPSSPTKSNQGSTASKDTKGAPRLKPSRQASAPPDSSSGKRKPAAAASRDGRGAAGAAAAGRPGGPGAKSKGTAASSRIVVNRGSDTPSSTKRSSDTSSSSTKRSSDTSSSAKLPPVINSGWRLPSNGKGFGSIPSQPTQAPGGPNLVQVFRFGVEAAAVCQVIEACGWQTRVALTDSIKDADIMLAAKCSPSGKHRNLAQVSVWQGLASRREGCVSTLRVHGYMQAH